MSLITEVSSPCILYHLWWRALPKINYKGIAK